MLPYNCSLWVYCSISKKVSYAISKCYILINCFAVTFDPTISQKQTKNLTFYQDIMKWIAIVMSKIVFYQYDIKYFIHNEKKMNSADYLISYHPYLILRCGKEINQKIS